MTVRKITNRGTKKNIGKFPSLKMGRTIYWESLIERDLIYLLEFDRDVIAYEEQPCRFRYLIDGKAHFYTPDFRVQRTQRREIVEVKPESKVRSEKNQMLFQIMKQVCRREGLLYTVVSDLMVRQEPLLRNVKLFYRYARNRICIQHQLLLSEFYSSRQQSTIEDLAKYLSTCGIKCPMQIVYSLLYHGYLEVDLQKGVNAKSTICLPELIAD